MWVRQTERGRARTVASTLAAAGVAAETTEVPTTLEEVFVELARQRAA